MTSTLVIVYIPFFAYYVISWCCVFRNIFPPEVVNKLDGFRVTVVNTCAHGSSLLTMQEKVSSSKKRKKKLNKQGNNSPTKKKKTYDDNYTEIRFKFELRDANLTFLGVYKIFND